VPVVSFFFDPGEAASRLAWARLEETALRTAARVEFCPVVAADLPPATEPCPAEARYLAKDLADWAQFCGVPLCSGGAPPPVAGRAALLLAVLQGDARLRPALDAWFASLHGSGAADLALVAAAAGLEPGALAAAEADPAARARLAANAQRLVALGGWRTPACAVGEALFVGHERLSLVEVALTQASERRLVLPGAHSQTVVDPAGSP
jgi:2-hydroxychromene-2-carboxylate isomerase